MRFNMRLCDEHEEEQTAESAASSCSRNTERLNVTRFSRQHLPADDDEQISRAEFPTAVYLLMKQNQSQQLIDFNYNLEASVAKIVCVRTSSKGFPPSF